MADAQSIVPRAEDFGVHDLVDPRETRPLVCDWLDDVAVRLETQRGPRGYGPRP